MVFRLEARQTLATDLDSAWAFFSDPRNLAEITPPDMHFRLTSRLTSRMTSRMTSRATSQPAAEAYPGMMISYRLSPLLGIEVGWVTEITQVAAPFYFADEQRVGPYALWHHEHHSRALDAGAIGGVEAIDVVHWSLPLDLLSWPVAMYVVGPRLREIFRYRAERLAGRFGAIGEAGLTIARL